MNPGFWSWTRETAAGRDCLARERAFFAESMSEFRPSVVVCLGERPWGNLKIAATVRAFSLAADNADVRGDPTRLPLADDSVDVLLMPHSLDVGAAAWAILSESVRVLRPSGHLLLTGFNARSLWFASRLWNGEVLPRRADLAGLRQVKQWAASLNLLFVRGRYLIHTPPLRDEKALRRWRCAETALARWCPQAAAVYGLVAIKQTPALRPLPASFTRPVAPIDPDFAGVVSGRVPERH